MTEIQLQSINKIVILEAIKYAPVEDLFADAVAGLTPGTLITLLWAEGIVFRHTVMPPQSDEVVKNRIQGTVFWDCVSYAKMDKYEQEKTFGMHIIRLIKATSPRSLMPQRN
ncbi:MAG: hypothetical protein ABIH76_04005 [Candidatus Bathyarchaeota archaeon]